MISRREPFAYSCMKWMILLATALLFSSCAGRHPINVHDDTGEIRVNRLAKVPLITVQQIADARGGKEDGEIWHVDRQKSGVRIRKSRNGSNPDDDVEVWYQDADGSWMQRQQLATEG